MKKIFLALPVIFLLAAGCNSSTTTQTTNDQTQPTQQVQTTPTPQQQVAQNPTPNSNLKTYTNTQYGFEFNYPSTYSLKTSNKTNVAGQKFIINISSSTNGLNSAPASTISISVWDNSQQLPPLEWATTNSSFSNYGSGSLNKNLKNEILTGHKAISYSWTGMNEGKTVVIANSQTIILLDTSANSMTDSVWQNFDDLISTFKFTK